jgi:plastocyanin
MKKLFLIQTILISFISLKVYSQCDDADHIIILNNFDFVPSELTIEPGETVAFINIEGEHTVNGITNSVNNEPFNNPTDIFL